MSEKLSTQQICALRGRAQTMEPVIKVGKQGLTPSFVKGVDEALTQHELIKVKFADLKDQKRALSPQLAEQTQSTLVTLIGNVLVLYRQNPDPAKRKITL